MDAKSLELLKLVYPDIRTRFFRLSQDVKLALGVEIRVTSAFRTMAEQAEIFAFGRQWFPDYGPPLPAGVIPMTKEKGVWRIVGKVRTKARPGLSLHHYGLAFDIAIVGADPYFEKLQAQKGLAEYDRLWRVIGKAGQSNGLTWGYDWNGNGVVDGDDFDRPHFQLLYGMPFHQIVDLYAQGGLTSVWYACDKVRKIAPMSEWKPEMLPTREEVV